MSPRIVARCRALPARGNVGSDDGQRLLAPSSDDEAFAVADMESLTERKIRPILLRLFFPTPCLSPPLHCITSPTLRRILCTSTQSWQYTVEQSSPVEDLRSYLIQRATDFVGISSVDVEILP